MLAYKSYLSIIQQDPKQLPDLIDDGTWREAALARNPCLYRWLNDGQLPAIMKEFGLPETLPMIERRSVVILVRWPARRPELRPIAFSNSTAHCVPAAGKPQSQFR